jgi:hypothetical protein
VPVLYCPSCPLHTEINIIIIIIHNLFQYRLSNFREFKQDYGLPRLKLDHKYQTCYVGIYCKGDQWGIRNWHMTQWQQIVIPLAPMGVLAPRLRMLDVSARPPIDTSGNFPAHMSAESPLNISPNLSEVISKVLDLLGGTVIQNSRRRPSPMQPLVFSCFFEISKVVLGF